jgi:hypothetical protein
LSNFKHIESKLNAFIKKYYKNELLKGSILFLSLGLLYFLFTLFIEYFLWLKPVFRTILFYSFIVVELYLLIKFIIIPIIKLFGLQKGISYIDASKIIGKHFKEVDDKLINILQLKNSDSQSELLLASIEQKSIDLKPIPFLQAINFSNNKKYLKYLAIPVIIFIVTFLFNKSIINDSLSRVVNYKKEYRPPAPFFFEVKNENLTVLEGKPFTINLHTVGEVIPENVLVNYDDNSYYIKEINPGVFTYTFEPITSNKTFYFSANGITSPVFQLNVVKTPKIENFKMYLHFPKHTHKKDEIVENTGNSIVPEGTTITWKIKTQNTNTLIFKSFQDSITFKKENKDFILTKRINKSLDYSVSASNQYVSNFEKLDYNIQMVSDQYPKMIIKTNIDSISSGNAQFIGQLIDDYGISKLQLVYYDRNNKVDKQNFNIPVINDTFQEFFYIFPENLNLKKGKDYEFYFQLFDNDEVNNYKSIKSRIYHYHHKTDNELKETILKEQKKQLENLNSTTKSTEKLSKAIDDFSNKLKNKTQMDWQDKKKFQEFLKRQEKYNQMLQRNTEKLQQNLNELKKEKNPFLQEKKQDLKKRLEEIKELQKKKKLLDELKKLAEKLDKEGFLQKLDKLTKKNKQDQRSLERILEMTKRFYAEKKAEEISNKLKELSKKQEDISKQSKNDLEKQKEINKEFKKIKEEFKDLDKLNKDLKQPLSIPKTETDQQKIEEDLKQAEEELDNKNSENNSDFNKDSKSSKAQKKQKSASRKMKRLSEKLMSSMLAGEGEMFEEDIDNLRRIIDNLILFSVEQEALMESLRKPFSDRYDFSKKIKKQQVLKEYFEHIDDSIYSLSLRMPKMSVKIQEDIIDAHYNLDQSLENFSNNKIYQTVKNQQFTMTSANNLANFLSDLLDNSQNPASGEGQGKGKGKGMGKGKGKGFSLPDIIQKQSDLLSKVQKQGNQKGGQKPNGSDGNKQNDKSGKGNKSGNKGKSGKNGGSGQSGNFDEQKQGELFKIYQEQNALRQQLQDLLNKDAQNGSSGNKVLKKMEELERMLINKGLTNQVLEKMNILKHELLKLDKALLEQGEDNKRKSDTNKIEFKKRSIKYLQTKKIFFNPNEILNRQALPLRTFYKKKVQIYFQNNN